MSRYNNIFNKKNIEYSLDGQNTSLPYTRANRSEVELKADQIIFTSINNIFQKLLDNDLYNERLLKQYIDNGLVGGPTYVSSVNSVWDEMNLGTKFVVSGANGISVLRKDEVDVSDTLSGRYLDGTKVNRLSFINERYVACTENGIYESVDKVNWTRRIGQNGIDVVDICYNQNFLNSSSISAYDYIAVANNGTSATFYGHSGIDYTWERISDLELSNTKATRIFSFEDDSKLYVGTSTGLLGSTFLRNDREFNVEIGTTRNLIYDMADIPEADEYNRYLLATNYGLKQLQQIYGFGGLSKQYSSSDTSILDAIYTNGIYYIATQGGTIKADNSKTNSRVVSTPSYALENTSAGLLVGTNNGIYKISNSESSLFALNGKTITKLATTGTTIFAYSSSDNKLYYSADNGNFWDTFTDSSFNPGNDEYVKQLKTKDEVLYVVTNKDVYAIVNGTTTTVFAWMDSTFDKNNVKFAQNVTNNKVLLQVGQDISLLNINDISLSTEIFHLEDVIPSNRKISSAIKQPNEDVYYIVISNILYEIKQVTEEKEEYDDSNKKDDEPVEEAEDDSSEKEESEEKDSDNEDEEVVTTWQLDKVLVNDSEVKAKSIAYYKDSVLEGIVFVDNENNAKFLRISDNRLFDMSDESGHSEITVNEGTAYSISGNSVIVRYNVDTTYSVEPVQDDVEDLVSLQEYNKLGYTSLSNNYEVKNSSTYVSAFSDAIKIDIDDKDIIEVQLEDAKLCAVDFIGYANNITGKKSLLIGNDSGVSALNIDIEAKEYSEIGTVLEKSPTTFADVCCRNDSINGNKSSIANTMNFIGTDDGLYHINAVSSFIKQQTSENLSINAVAELNGNHFIGTDNGIYTFDPDNETNLAEQYPDISVNQFTQQNDRFIIVASNENNILMSCDNNSINSLFDSSRENDDLLSGVEAKNGGILSITRNTLDYLSSDKYGFLENPVILTSQKSDTDIERIYKDGGIIYVVDVLSNLYSLTINSETNTYSLNKIGGVEPKNLLDIVKDGLANSDTVIDKKLSIGYDLDDITEDTELSDILYSDIVRTYRNPEESTKEYSFENQNALELENTTTLKFVTDERKILYTGDGYLSGTISSEVEISNLENVSVVNVAQILEFTGYIYKSAGEDEDPVIVEKTVVLSDEFILDGDNRNNIITVDLSSLKDLDGYLTNNTNLSYVSYLSIDVKNNDEIVDNKLDLSYKTSALFEFEDSTVKRLLVVQDSIDGLYYDPIQCLSGDADNTITDTLIGYVVKNNDGKLLYFDGKDLVLGDGYKTKEVEEELGFIHISKTLSNDSFNDLYYFRIGNNFENNPIRKTPISTHGKKFNVAKEETTAGAIKQISFEDNLLYVISPYNQWLEQTLTVYSNDFPNYKYKGGVGEYEIPPDSILASCKNYTVLYSKGDGMLAPFRKDFDDYGDKSEIGAIYISEIPGFGTVENLFANGLDKILIKTTTGIWNTFFWKDDAGDYHLSASSIIDFIKEDNAKSYFIDSDYYVSPVVITNNSIYTVDKVYDFTRTYTAIGGISEKVVDIKTLNPIEKNPTLYVATQTGIYKYKIENFDTESPTYTLSKDPLTFTNIKGIYFSQDVKTFYVIDENDLLIFEDFSENKTISSITPTIVKDFLYGDIATQKIRIGDFRNYHPVIITLTSINQFETDSRFFEDSEKYVYDGNLSGFVQPTLVDSITDTYLYSNNVLLKLSSDGSEYGLETLYRSDSLTAFKNLLGVTQHNDGLIFFKPGTSKITEYKVNGSDFTSADYLVQSSPTQNGIFSIGTDDCIATNQGIYKKKETFGLVTDSTNEVHLLAESIGNDVNFNRLEFLLGNNFVLNYTESAVVDKNIVRASRFASNIESITEVLNNDYISTEPLTVLDKVFDRYLFVSDGSTGYVYTISNNSGKTITLEQLENVNDGNSVLLFLKGGRNYGMLGYGNTFATFNGFSKIKIFGEVNNEYVALKNNFRQGTQLIEILNENPDFLIGTTYGLKYVYNDLMTRSFYNRDSDLKINSLVTAIKKVLISSSTNNFIVGQNNSLFEVTDLRNTKFRLLHDFPEDETILDIFIVRKSEYIIATNKGIYTTSMQYKLIDDLRLFTVENIYEIINDELKKIIQKHISEKHRPESLITRVNAKADNKLSFISSEDKHSEMFDVSLPNAVRVVKDDIIDTIVRGGESPTDDSYVKVGISNWALNNIQTTSTYTSDGFANGFIDPTSGKEFDISVVPYVVKNWKSGLKEIYIYVPTTGTYYANNPQGITNSSYSYNAYTRENIPNSSLLNTLATVATTLRVYLYNSYFNIKTILAAQCTGNSLPLKIYKDNVNEDDAWKGVFDTVIQPSALRTLPMTESKSVNNVSSYIDSLGRICLDFSIYGTDAQAIRIIAES